MGLPLHLKLGSTISLIYPTYPGQFKGQLQDSYTDERKRQNRDTGTASK